MCILNIIYNIFIIIIFYIKCASVFKIKYYFLSFYNFIINFLTIKERLKFVGSADR